MNYSANYYLKYAIFYLFLENATNYCSEYAKHIIFLNMPCKLFRKKCCLNLRNI